jgi:hypothetical protein
MNDKEVDAHLDKVTDSMLRFKSGVMRNLGRIIVTAFLADPERTIMYPDAVDLGEVRQEDRNAVGIVWRMLKNNGILEETGAWKRSVKDASHGRKIFQYRLTNQALAQRFLLANRSPAEMLTTTPVYL